MDSYRFDLTAALRFRELIGEYGALRRLENTTPQLRGQRFNQFIADVLACWGIERVQVSVRGAGEIDVAFALDGTRFVLEAKWEAEPVDFGPIAKLSRRITQRLTGTRGVFLSMSGYTAGALGDATRGQQPDMLLLDRGHMEAMLSGLLSPTDLFTELLDRASYSGNVHVPLADLLPAIEPELPEFVLGTEPDQGFPVVTDTAPGVLARVILHGTKPHATTVDGVAFDPAGRLLLTLPSGVARIDLGTGITEWAVSIPGCRGSALPLPDGSILVLRGPAVLRWRDSTPEVAAGGFAGGTSLLPGPDGQAWVFDYKTAGWPGGERAVLVVWGQHGIFLPLPNDPRDLVSFARDLGAPADRPVTFSLTGDSFAWPPSRNTCSIRTDPPNEASSRGSGMNALRQAMSEARHRRPETRRSRRPGPGRPWPARRW